MFNIQSFLFGGVVVFLVFLTLSFTQFQENPKQEVMTVIFNEPSTVSAFSALSIVVIDADGQIDFQRIQLKRHENLYTVHAILNGKLNVFVNAGYRIVGQSTGQNDFGRSTIYTLQK